jgi:hypothetical protein
MSLEVVVQSLKITGMRYFFLVGFFCFCLFTPTALAQASSFTSGDRVVVVTDAVKVRDGAGLSFNTLGSQKNGAGATVLATSGGLIDSYLWLQLDYDEGVDGWSAAGNADEAFIQNFDATALPTDEIDMQSQKFPQPPTALGQESFIGEHYEIIRTDYSVTLRVKVNVRVQTFKHLGDTEIAPANLDEVATYLNTECVQSEILMLVYAPGSEMAMAAWEFFLTDASKGGWFYAEFIKEGEVEAGFFLNDNADEPAIISRLTTIPIPSKFPDGTEFLDGRILLELCQTDYTTNQILTRIESLITR